MGFEVIRGEVAESRVPPFSIVIGDVMADFQARFGEVAEAAAVEQFGLEAAPKGLGGRIIIAVAAPTHALHGLVAGY